MANSVVGEKVCDLCGAEVRDGSAFCYNCGTAVAEKPAESAIIAKVDDKARTHNGTSIPSTPEAPGSRPARPRTRPRRAVIAPREVVWTEKEGPSVWFAAFAITFAIVTAVIVVVAYYFR
jgi:hypothetical protein